MKIIFFLFRCWGLHHSWDTHHVFLMMWQFCLVQQVWHLSPVECSSYSKWPFAHVTMTPLSCGIIVVFFTYVNIIVCFCQREHVIHSSRQGSPCSSLLFSILSQALLVMLLRLQAYDDIVAHSARFDKWFFHVSVSLTWESWEGDAHMGSICLVIHITYYLEEIVIIHVALTKDNVILLKPSFAKMNFIKAF